MTDSDEVGGYAAVTAERPELGRRLAEHLARRRDGRVQELDASAWLVRWGPRSAVAQTTLLVPAHTPRTRSAHDATSSEPEGPSLGPEPGAVPPPCAAVDWSTRRRELTAQVDWLGCCHVYTTQGWHWSAVSSSAGALGSLRGLGLDDAAIRFQAMLGRQPGLRTLHAGVRRLAPGEKVVLEAGTSRSEPAVRAQAGTPATTTRARRAREREAAGVIRDLVGRLVEDHPDALLQLTGGVGSRILLAAVPTDRRADVEALTLVVPGSDDVRIAARLAREHGMRHHLVRWDGLEAMSPAEAYARCSASAARVEASADPLARAALLWAERDLSTRPRVAGLGGGAACDLGLLGASARLPVTRALAGALVRRRLTSAQVEPDAVHPDFLHDAERQVVDDTHAALAPDGRHGRESTDQLFLWQRAQRWGGVLASVTCTERPTINPMLDQTFVDLVRSVPSGEKRTMLLSRILVELDPGLASVELDRRPAARVYAVRSWGGPARLALSQGRRVASTLGQLGAGRTSPPAGDDVLAGKVTEHWRAEPELLEPVRALGVFRDSWLDQVLLEGRRPSSSTVALLLTLAVALASREDQLGSSRSQQPSRAGRVEGRSNARRAAWD